MYRMLRNNPIKIYTTRKLPLSSIAEKAKNGKTETLLIFSSPFFTKNQSFLLRVAKRPQPTPHMLELKWGNNAF